jgi:mannosyltransferase
VKNKVITAKLPLTIGSVLIITGIVLPTSTLIAFLRTRPEALGEQLILGAKLFKTGLVFDGLFVLALGWMITCNLGKQNERRVSERYDIASTSILVGILLTALLLRLYNLNFGMWFDEILTYVYYMDRSLGEIITTYSDQNNHLLYNILARISFFMFGASVWSLRLPAVLFGVASIWAIYVLSCDLGYRREGLLSAGLLTFSYHHVWFSQNARGYTGLLFWTIFSSWLLLRALREGKLQLWMLYATSVALGAYTHITMVVVVIGQFVVYLITVFRRSQNSRPEWWIGGVVGFVLAGIITFQLYAFLLPQILNWRSSTLPPWQGRVMVAAWRDPVWMLLELIGGMNITFGSIILVIVAIFVFGVGIRDFLRKEPSVVWLLFVPVLIGLTVIMVIGSTLFPRFFFFALGFGVLIVIRGTVLAGEVIGRFLCLDFAKRYSLGIFLCVGLISVSAISVPLAYAPKQDYEGALQFVEGKKQPGDVVVTFGLTALPYESFYKVDWKEIRALEDLKMVRSLAKRTWLVYTMPTLVESASPEIMNSIRRDFSLVKEFPGTLNGGSIFVCLVDS